MSNKYIISIFKVIIYVMEILNYYVCCGISKFHILTNDNIMKVKLLVLDMTWVVFICWPFILWWQGNLGKHPIQYYAIF